MSTPIAIEVINQQIQDIDDMLSLYPDGMDPRAAPATNEQETQEAGVQEDEDDAMKGVTTEEATAVENGGKLEMAVSTKASTTTS